ncbi:hypothetical protein M0804_013604 [Polistes exclamans]|nr:hypothetical protein M0804_013604 [Polistes exclamans]
MGFRFELKAVASQKNTSYTGIAVTSITTEKEEQYVIPNECIYTEFHEELMNIDKVKKAKEALKKRHDELKIWIPLTEELKKIYSDEEGDLCFRGDYLVKVIQEQTEKHSHLEKILEKFVENSERKEKEINLKRIIDIFILEKFNFKTSYVKQWLDSFEKEFEKMNIEKDKTKIELFRSVIDGTCNDWYTSTILKGGCENDWSGLKQELVGMWANKGWGTRTYAHFFRYKEGSLVQYAIKKERLLLEINRNMDSDTVIDRIAIGLPESIRENIDRDELKNIKDLIYKLQKLKRTVEKQSILQKEAKQEYRFRNEDRKPCKVCREIGKLIDNNKSVFARDKYDVGTASEYEARIDLMVEKYCSKRPYRCNIKDREEIEKQINKLLERKLIEESYSPFAAPVTLAYKKDERKTRMCIDFRDLNKNIVPQAQPFPLIDDIIIRARNCKYFTTLDINSAIWSIPLRIEDRRKTGFVTQNEHFQWTCLPFGLKTSPGLFQRILSNILRKHGLMEFAINYIDDMLIHSPTFEEHLDHIERVLKAINKEGFRLKFKKCTFAAGSVRYLGHIIGKNTVTPLKDNITLIENFPTPTTQKQEMHKEWGYKGMIQTKMKIRPYYTAKNLEENIKKICRECDICVKNKSRGQGKFGLMSQLGPATKAFEIVSIDTIGGFGGTRSTKKYINLLVDHFTRYAFIFTSKTENANDFIKLVESVLQIDKIETILTDQYPVLNSKEFKDYVKKKNMQIIFTAINSPFSNGLNERLNQTLLNRKRCKINEEEKKRAWTTIARECVNRYNRLKNTITGFTPEYLLHGTDTSNIPRELRRKKNGKDWVKDKKLALERTLKSHNSNRNIFDKNRKDHQFKVGDKVFIENGNKLNRKKLEQLRIGPFTIEEKVLNSIYKIKTDRRNQDKSLFHVTKLIPLLKDDYD